MKKKHLKILWPNKAITTAEEGENWFSAAENADIEIPSGCLTGSCGACEIDVNGETIRACVNNIEFNGKTILEIDFTSDPFW